MKHEANKLPRKRSKLLVILCLLAATLLSFNGCFLIENNGADDNKLPPASYESPWTTAKTVTKRMVGTNNRTFTATISQENRTTPVLPQYENDETICLEMCAEVLLSSFSFDFSLYNSMFAPQQLAAYEHNELTPRGFSLQEAELRIEEVVQETFGLCDFYVDLSVRDIAFDTTEAVEYFQDSYSSRFAEWGMDIDKIERYAICTFERISFKFHDTLEYRNFQDEISGSSIALYRYDGVWYIEPEWLDDTEAIDFLESEKGKTSGYYRERKQTGKVSMIKNNLIFIDDTLVSPVTEACKDLSVGDEVVVKYYTTWCTFSSDISESALENKILVGVIFSAEPPVPVIIE